MKYNEMLLQYVGIAIVLGACIVWIYRRLRRKGGSCSGCALSDACLKKNTDEQKTCKKSAEDLDNTKD